tara:strand:+ start:278 stop:562 length:285 start_codon:yes stop_codon:yes gene_type:complete
MNCECIYTPDVGKPIPRLARSGIFLKQRVDAQRANQKAVAIHAAETLMPSVGLNFDSTWQYDATESIKDKWYHHFYQGTAEEPTRHLWILSTPV